MLSGPPDVPAGGGQGPRIFYLIARREFITRVRSRFFLVGTALLMALLAGYIVLQALVLSRATTTVDGGFEGGAQALAQPLKTVAATETLNVRTHLVQDMAAGESQVQSGRLDFLVSGDPAGPNVTVKDDLNPTVAAMLSGLVKQVALDQAIRAGGADPAVIDGKIAAARIHLVVLDPDAAVRTQRQVVGIVVAALLYVALVLYGQLVASGVVEEKANRIIEILLSTVRPRQLLFGKVVGIGLMGLLQLVLLGTVGLITATRMHVIDLPSVGVTAVAGGLVWFVLGFTFYALIFAAGGSLISRQEDLSAVTAPISMLIVGAYLAFFWVEANPTNPWGVLLSMLPPFAPTLMPARMATGDAQTWQILVAVVLMIGGIAALNWLAARIYFNSVLRVGSRVKLLEAWRGPQ